MTIQTRISELMAEPDWDVDCLKKSLQIALEIEFTTIPPYLTAWWSIENDADEASGLIREIVIEEMLHFGIACNLLVAIGGDPWINTSDAVPKYPCHLPGGVAPDVEVSLVGLSPQVLDDFIKIEEPEFTPVALVNAPQKTIGAFYTRISSEFERLNPQLFPDRQQKGPLGLVKVTSIDEVKRQIDKIKRQGEGTASSPADTSLDDLAHFYRFKEIRIGKRLIPVGNTGKFDFVGPEIPFPGTWPVARIPEGGYLKENVSDEVWNWLSSFDATYSAMLDKLQLAWRSGQPQALLDAVTIMYDLAEPAISLMRTAIPGSAQTYGPCFRYVPPAVPTPPAAALRSAQASMAAAGPPMRFRTHGVVRGLEGIPKSPSHEGRFGRMFRTLPAASWPEDALRSLAALMVATPEAEQTPEDRPDAEEAVGSPADPAIPAGFTYFGQFIDHDLTFDPASSLQKANDPDGLVDFRTPKFDLDCIYGRGPDDQPYLYQDDGVRMLLGRDLTGNASDPSAKDVPRNSPRNGAKRALIGDPRNDENVIVSQLQAAFLRFHNRVADVLHANGPSDFANVQRIVRWHYQWAVLHDFLPTIVQRETLLKVLPHLEDPDGKASIADKPPKVEFFQWKKEPFMPVEFSVAAYRFGHSMVRPVYRLSQTVPAPDDSDGRLPIFSNDPNRTLVGFREFPANWAIDWNLFFELRGPRNRPSERLQPAYKIDTSLVNPLGSLPASVATLVPSLAERNLLRGMRMGLPSGQSVARSLGVAVIPDEKLKVGKATKEDVGGNMNLVDISPAFRGKAPLWYYILAEAQQQFDGNDDARPLRLGPVGGRIVAEVFVGLMLGDSHSFLNQDPDWKPIQSFTRNGIFGVAELVLQAMKA